MKRYKVKIKFATSVKTGVYEAASEEEAERKAIAALNSWDVAEKKMISVEEVGAGQCRERGVAPQPDI